MSYSQINVTMELVSGFVLLVLAGSMLAKKQKKKRDHLFLAILLCHALSTFSDAAAWGFSGKPGVLPLLLTSAGNLLTYLTGAATYLGFLLYIIDGAQTDRQGERATGVIKGIMLALSAAQLAITLLNLFNGMLYTIDANNVFRWGPWNRVPHVIMLAQNLLLIIQLVHHRKILGRRDTLLYLTYTLLPFVSIAISVRAYWLMLVYPVTAIALLLIYVNIQLEQERRLIQKELELSENRASAMLSQIQPHFLYNSLAAIQSLCVRNPREAEEAVTEFSDYLRGNLDSMTNKNPIRLSRELAHVRNYLSLEKRRFGDRLTVEYRLGPVDFLLPALSLQPLVENAVRHTLTRTEGDIHIRISSDETKSAWTVTVADDGIGFDPDSLPGSDRCHVGIRNVRQRLELQCGGALALQSRPGGGTTATISIPKEG